MRFTIKHDLNFPRGKHENYPERKEMEANQHQMLTWSFFLAVNSLAFVKCDDFAVKRALCEIYLVALNFIKII
jgi:hypothetical protein